MSKKIFSFHTPELQVVPLKMDKGTKKFFEDLKKLNQQILEIIWGSTSNQPEEYRSRQSVRKNPKGR